MISSLLKLLDFSKNVLESLPSMKRKKEIRKVEKELTLLRREQRRYERENLSYILQPMNVDKINRILEYRKKGMTMAEIGKEMGITGSRIQQISTRIPDFPAIPNRRVKKLYPFTCSQCGKKSVRTDRREVKNRFCDSDCKIAFSRRNSGIMPTYGTVEWKEYNRIRCNKYYHEHLKGKPEFKKITKIRNRMYQDKLRSDPVRYREYLDKQNAHYKKKYWDRMKERDEYRNLTPSEKVQKIKELVEKARSRNSVSEVKI